ncbi:MAG: dihydropteroate synthase [Sulfurospirillaceae bacterium]|nr:dihydropteroate synthase [Sulfurospirillaceae bacterium]
MRLYRLDEHTNLEALFNKIGVTHEGSVIMRQKSKINLLYIEGIKSPAANILKQDALSIGADLAVPKDTITCKDATVDAILMATDAQLRVLSKKEKVQPFGLKTFADKITSFLMLPDSKVSIMGVVNTNKDSFYKNSRFSKEQALLHVEKMIEDGADIVDIGGVSSRPGSVAISQEEELARIQDVVDAIYAKKLYEKAQFSLDSYSPLCLRYALERGFSIVNDITALENDEVAKIVSLFDATVVLMHKKGLPQTMQESPKYDNVILEVDDFFTNRIEKAKSFGIKKMILDTGIGFGKTLEHNLLLIKHHAHFLHFGYPLLMGASRKSLIDKIYPCDVKDRLAGTLAIHLRAVENGASIIRVHDVKEHAQALHVAQAINKIF